jgi:hypothetical protein
MDQDRRQVPVEQLRYAEFLKWSVRVALALLVIGFAAYMLEFAPAHVPFDQLVRLWSQPMEVYLREAAIPTGWSWVAVIHKGEFASLGGIVILAGCSLVSLVAVIPIYARRGDRLHAAFCVLEILVLAAAASGLLTLH